ncbi:MAG: peptidoglycan-binding protein [Patescibacteria group bacterium]
MDKFKKFIAGSLVALMAVSAASPAAAVTIEELLAQIAALQAQLVALQSQQGGGSYVGVLTKNLKQGMTDPEVNILQSGLAKDSAVYPEGLVTGYFGPLTKAAVIRFQEKYASEVLAPWGLTNGTGFVGSTTRDKFNALYGQAAPTVSPTPGVSPAPADSVSVALSPDAPAAGTLVADSTSGDGAQALASVAAFRFTAPAAGAVKVTSLKVQRTGVSADADVSNMYLYVDGARVAESPSISSGYFTFTNSAGLFEVPAGSYKDVVVKIDLSNGTSSGKTFIFGLAAADSVVAGVSTVSGSFPIYGSQMTTAQISDLGKMTISSALPSSNTTVDAGTTNYEVFRFSALASDQPQKVSYMKFTLVGTADYDALQNIGLYVDGTQVGSSVAMMGTDKTVEFDLSSAPLSFTSGQTRTVALRADVIKGSGRNFYFQVAKSSDFVSMDTTYNVYLKTNQSNVWSLFKAAGTTSINSGSIVTNKASDSPTGPLALNATNMKIAKFELKAVGEDVKVSSMYAKVVESVNSHIVSNLKLYIAGSQFGSTVASPADSTVQTFSGNYTFKAGETVVVEIYADLTGTLANGDSITATLEDNDASNGVRQSTGDSIDVPSSDVGANAISISAGTLSAVKNSSVANISTVLNAQDVVIASWLITAPSDQGVRINSITVDDGQSSTNGLGSAFSNLMLFNGSTQLGQTIASPSTTGGSDNTFNISTTFEVPAGQSKQIDLKADVLSSASTSTWNGESTDAARITSMDATGLITNSATTYGSGNVSGQLITLNSGATLTIANEASPTMPDSTYVVAGDTEQTLAAWRFSANNTESVKVTRVKVFESGADDKPGNFKNVKLYVDGVQAGATVPAFTTSTATSSTNGWTMDYVLFEDNAGLFTVPQNSYKTLVVKADATDKSNASFVDDGAKQRFSLEITDGTATATTNVSAKGSTSNQYVTLESGSSATNELNGSAMTFARSRPVFAYVAASGTTLTPGVMEVFRFRITAHSSDDVKFMNTTASSNIRLTVLAGKAAATGDVVLYDAGTSTALQTASANSLATNATIDFNSFSSTVPAGTTKEYYVTANLSVFTTTGDSFQVSLKNAAADMSFNDNSSTSADIEEANYVGIGLPINGGVFTKPGA